MNEAKLDTAIKTAKEWPETTMKTGPEEIWTTIRAGQEETKMIKSDPSWPNSKKRSARE
jgi:hypothetical protein